MNKTSSKQALWYHSFLIYKLHGWQNGTEQEPENPSICGDLVPLIHAGKHALAFDTVHMKQA